MIRRFATLVILPLLLAACGGGDAEPVADDGQGARGEVLGGTISDDMIPLDQLTSHSPPQAEAAGGASADGGAGEDAAPDAAPDTQPDEAEAADAAPDPEPDEQPEG